MRISVLIFAVLFLVTISQTAVADDAWQLTTDGGYPTWSPDGSMIAFASNYDIWVVPASGGTPTQLTTDPAVDESPAWSPDGSRIAFTSDRIGGTNVWIIPSTGAPPATQLTFGGGFEPAWSPDGTQIAFMAYSAQSGSVQIWIIPATGGVAIQLTGDPGGKTSPSWSPDGNWIAYRMGARGVSHIFAIPATGGVPMQLTTTNLNAAPAWSPDGAQIAFASGRSGNGDIWIMPSTGEPPATQLTFDPAEDDYPAWSPDGSQIAFERWLRGIWIIDAPIPVEPTTWGAIKASFH